MTARRLRVTVFAILLLLVATQLPAPIQPDCNNQPTLQCGMTCYQAACQFIIWGDGSSEYRYCYEINGGCMGGYNHPCCL